MQIETLRRAAQRTAQGYLVTGTTPNTAQDMFADAYAQLQNAGALQ